MATETDIKPILHLEDENPKGMPAPGEHLKLSHSAKQKLLGKLKSHYTDAKKRDDGDLEDYWREYLCTDRPWPKSWPITTADGMPHSANLRIRVIRAIVDAWLAQTNKVVMGADELFDCRVGVGDSDFRRADRVERHLNWWSSTEADYRIIRSMVAARVAVEGVGILHVPWRANRRFTIHRPGATEGSKSFMERMGLKEPPATVAWEPVYSGPMPEVVPRDSIFLYPATEWRIQDAWGVFYRYRLTRDDLLRGIKDGKFKLSDEDRKTLKDGGDQSEPVASEKGAGDQQEAAKVDFEAVDVYCGYDVDGDGLEEPCLFTFLPERNLLIRAMVSPTGGLRPFAQYYAREHGGRFGGVSIPQIIEPLAVAIEAAMNQTMDISTLNMLLVQSPMIKQAAGIEVDDDWLGRPNEVLDGGAVTFPPLVPAHDKQAFIEMCWTLIERLTGVSANFMGSPVPVQKTATEISAVVSLGNMLFEQQTRRLADGDAEFAEIASYQFYLNAEDVIRYQGPVRDETLDQHKAMVQQAEEFAMQMQMDPNQLEIPPEPETETWELRAEDYKPPLHWTATGATANLNRDFQRNEAGMMAQMYAEDPFVMEDAQRAWELRSRVADMMGWQNIEQIIGPKPKPGSPMPNIQAMAQELAQEMMGQAMKEAQQGQPEAGGVPEMEGMEPGVDPAAGDEFSPNGAEAQMMAQMGGGY